MLLQLVVHFPEPRVGKDRLPLALITGRVVVPIRRI